MRSAATAHISGGNGPYVVAGSVALARGAASTRSDAIVLPRDGRTPVSPADNDSSPGSGVVGHDAGTHVLSPTAFLRAAVEDTVPSGRVASTAPAEAQDEPSVALREGGSLVESTTPPSASPLLSCERHISVSVAHRGSSTAREDKRGLPSERNGGSGNAVSSTRAASDDPRVSGGRHSGPDHFKSPHPLTWQKYLHDKNGRKGVKLAIRTAAREGGRLGRKVAHAFLRHDSAHGGSVRSAVAALHNQTQVQGYGVGVSGLTALLAEPLYGFAYPGVEAFCMFQEMKSTWELQHQGQNFASYLRAAGKQGVILRAEECRDSVKPVLTNKISYVRVTIDSIAAANSTIRGAYVQKNEVVTHLRIFNGDHDVRRTADRDWRYQSAAGLKALSLDAAYSSDFYSAFMQQLFTLCIPRYDTLRMAAYGPLLLFTAEKTDEQVIHRDGQDGRYHVLGEDYLVVHRDEGYIFLMFSISSPAAAAESFPIRGSDFGLRIVPLHRDYELTKAMYRIAGMLDAGFAPSRSVVKFFQKRAKQAANGAILAPLPLNIGDEFEAAAEFVAIDIDEIVMLQQCTAHGGARFAGGPGGDDDDAASLNARDWADVVCPRMAGGEVTAVVKKWAGRSRVRLHSSFMIVPSPNLFASRKYRKVGAAVGSQEKYSDVYTVRPHAQSFKGIFNYVEPDRYDRRWRRSAWLKKNRK